MAKPKVLKPYVKSAVTLKDNWRRLSDFSDLKTLISSENLARQTSRGIKRRLKREEKAGTSNEAVTEDEKKVEVENKPKIFVGMRSALRQLNNNELGAFIIDKSVVGPSAVAHVFNLMSLNKNCDFYQAEGLSKELSVLLNMPKVSVIGIGKDEPLIIQLKLSEPKAEPEKPQPKFVKPTFRLPVGKNKPKKKKK
ncbi:unnamed protein product [Bursaphelenchus xylophilus]|uniref:(pine wood nematode) hypothetical protein n=1 Tax=Bursaphelenchus xylophilus TaxID=6326 RepID=A0A1I7S8L0_BURXY|nr:unnamed protein product [Bursaphelenchus xylophilus]CAG9089552.1 unnamed protein product [Bursaphelenchus xylophilus]